MSASPRSCAPRMRRYAACVMRSFRGGCDFAMGHRRKRPNACFLAGKIMSAGFRNRCARLAGAATRKVRLPTGTKVHPAPASRSDRTGRRAAAPPCCGSGAWRTELEGSLASTMFLDQRPLIGMRLCSAVSGSQIAQRSACSSAMIFANAGSGARSHNSSGSLSRPASS